MSRQLFIGVVQQILTKFEKLKTFFISDAQYKVKRNHGENLKEREKRNLF